jgi:hypothetical protein
MSIGVAFFSTGDERQPILLSRQATTPIAVLTGDIAEAEPALPGWTMAVEGLFI